MKNYVKPFKRPNVAILRDEGTTGDREMAAAFLLLDLDHGMLQKKNIMICIKKLVLK